MMSDETRRSPSGGRAEGPRTDDDVIYLNGAMRKTAPASAVRQTRDLSTEIITSIGLVVLAALETADVVGRATGRMIDCGTRDAVSGGTALVHTVAQGGHDAALDVAQTMVDTGIDLGAQVLRGAEAAGRQGRELASAAEGFAQGLIGFAFKLFRASRRPEPKTPLTAVPIVVN